jgi:GTP-binding protein
VKRRFRVVIAGRPNVGKSALFNRLLRRRRSLVHKEPGMTRDVLETDAPLPDGRTYRLLDTGGFDPEGREELPRAVRDRTIAAIRKADLVVLVVDAAVGVLPGDRSAARVVREAGVEALVAANKIDRREAEAGELEAWELGFSEVYGVSAEHNIGVDDLVDAIAARSASASGKAAADGLRSAEAPAEAEVEAKSEIALAVVGRPNVGKSSLVNVLLGEARMLVSEVPGTTRDSVDEVLQRGDMTFRLVDTAGIRRKSRTQRGPEVLSVVQARKQIEDCDVALLLVDASKGPAAQDAAVASLVQEAGKGLVLIGNKWDLAGGTESGAKSFRQALEERIPFARHAPVLLVSAKTGRGMGRILETAARVAANRRRRVPTAELNRVLGRALRDKAPRTASGKRLRVYYTAQTGVEPPTFTLVANRAEGLHFSENRRVENILREAAEFAGSPIRISVRARSRRARSNKPGAPEASSG